MVKLSLFSQITSLIPRKIFSEIVEKHQSNKHNKGIDSWAHLISMVFCHLGHANSVRDISNGLRSITGNLSHLGCKIPPSKSSISYINKHRPSELFRDFYYRLATHLRSEVQFAKPALKQLKRKIYILDSTTISLCLSLYDWAKFRTRKGAVKLHLLLDYEGCLPYFANLTNGSIADITAARNMQLPPNSILVFDKGYYDFEWWEHLDSMASHFVTRIKDNTLYQVVKEQDVSKQKDPNVKKDCHIYLSSIEGQKQYPKKLRLVHYWDEVNKKLLVFVTNNFNWTASTVAQVYKERWRIETFFKTIKQQLRIKSFVGTSENAVQIQIWTALITILLLTYLKLKAKYKWHMSNLVSFLRINLFVKIDLWKWLDQPFIKKEEKRYGQLSLFDT